MTPETKQRLDGLRRAAAPALVLASWMVLLRAAPALGLWGTAAWVGLALLVGGSARRALVLGAVAAVAFFALGLAAIASRDEGLVGTALFWLALAVVVMPAGARPPLVRLVGGMVGAAGLGMAALFALGAFGADDAAIAVALGTDPDQHALLPAAAALGGLGFGAVWLAGPALCVPRVFRITTRVFAGLIAVQGALGTAAVHLAPPRGTAAQLERARLAFRQRHPHATTMLRRALAPAMRDGDVDRLSWAAQQPFVTTQAPALPAAHRASLVWLRAEDAVLGEAARALGPALGRALPPPVWAALAPTVRAQLRPAEYAVLSGALGHAPDVQAAWLAHDAMSPMTPPVLAVGACGALHTAAARQTWVSPGQHVVFDVHTAAGAPCPWLDVDLALTGPGSDGRRTLGATTVQLANREAHAAGHTVWTVSVPAGTPDGVYTVSATLRREGRAPARRVDVAHIRVFAGGMLDLGANAP